MRTIFLSVFTAGLFGKKGRETMAGKVSSSAFNENAMIDPEPYIRSLIFDNICFERLSFVSNLEKYILYLSYSRGFLDKEISKVIGIHRAYITIIRNRALEKMKDIDIMYESY